MLTIVNDFSAILIFTILEFQNVIMRKAICFGEVLWDVFPNEKFAGGAPMNVAVQLTNFGVSSKIISKIGNDASGRELLKNIQNQNLTGVYIEIDPNYETGEAKVLIDDSQDAIYDIKYPAAWDKILPNPTTEAAVKSADIFLFGSLASRDEVSSNTLFHFLKMANFKVFDLNVRKPYCDIDKVMQLMLKADFIKMNEDELLYISKQLGSDADALEINILFLSEMTETPNVCITRGRLGAVLLTGESLYSHPGFQVDVVDTVGAGDAFLAALMSKFLDTNNYEKLLEFACAVGSVVSTKKGGASRLEIKEIENLIQGQLF